MVSICKTVHDLMNSSEKLILRYLTENEWDSALAIQLRIYEEQNTSFGDKEIQ